MTGSLVIQWLIAKKIYLNVDKTEIIELKLNKKLKLKQE